MSVKHNNTKYKTYNVTAGLYVSALTESSVVNDNESEYE